MRSLQTHRSESLVVLFILVVGVCIFAPVHSNGATGPMLTGPSGFDGPPGGTGAQGATGQTGSTGSTGPIKVTAAKTDLNRLLLADSVARKVIKITAQQDDKPKKDVRVDVRIANEESDSLLSSEEAKDQGESRDLIVTTDKDGVAAVSILTGSRPDTDIQVTPLVGPKATEKGDLDHVTNLAFRKTSGLRGEIGSKKTFFQLFIGTTFSNDYDASGKNTGFGNAGQIIRLTFDTLWRDQGDHANPPVKDTAQAFTYGNWRTDMNAEFSKFPFGASGSTGVTGVTGNTGETKGLANAFTGHLGLTWEPNAWAVYDPRDEKDVPANASALPKDSSDDWPYDVYRFALFSRAGVTTRQQASGTSPDHAGNTSIIRSQLGLRFTHRRSKYDSPEKEQYNVEPIRFVEISVAKFSKYGSQNNARRIVVDAGLRVGAVSNNVFPIYAGIHLNSGAGPDDLRVFLGMLVKLDTLANLVRKAGVPPPE